MKKSNWIAFIVAIIISAFLLWLWFFLGFDHIDAPLDLVLSIIWWVLVAVACFAIYRVEKKRQERVRTCYVSDRVVFNSEAGTVPAPEPFLAVRRMHDIIRDLEYGFDIQDMPDDVTFAYVVRSKVFKLKREADEQAGVEEELRWEGEVATVQKPDDDPVPFASREQLLQILEAARSAA